MPIFAEKYFMPIFTEKCFMPISPDEGRNRRKRFAQGRGRAPSLGIRPPSPGTLPSVTQYGRTHRVRPA